MKKIWQKWQEITKRIVSIQASFLLFFVYFILIIPLSFFLKISSKKALLGHKHSNKRNTFWIPVNKIKQDMNFAHEQ